MKKFLSVIFAALLVCSAFAFTAALADIPDNVINYSSEYNANVSAGAATVQKGVQIDGTKAAKIVPNADSGLTAVISLDSWMLDNNNFDLNTYKYATIKYKYDVGENTPSYDGRMAIRLLETGTKALTKIVEIPSVETVVTNTWATATFCIGSATEPFLNPDISVHHIKQMHLKPYGDTSLDALSVNDVMYIESITLTVTSPNENLSFEHGFAKSELRATGEMPVVKCNAGEQFTLPESSFAFEDADFECWIWSYDDKQYEPGDVLTMPEAFTTFTAKWKYKAEHKDVITLSYPSYYQKDGGATKGAIVTSVTENGQKAIRAQIDPAREADRTFTLNGWEYTRASVDLDVYKYMQITYKYLSEKPRNDIYLQYRITTHAPNGEKRFTDSYTATAQTPCEIGTWAVTTLDISPMSQFFVEGASHVFRQGIVYPFGNLSTADLHESDVMYIAQLDFYKDYPGNGSHSPYITGYENNTFRPSGTMTRAEACTIAARVFAGGDAAIPTGLTTVFTDVASDAWYHKYIAYCESRGLLPSYSGAFLPSRNITRAEFVEIIYNMGLVKDKGLNGAFTDVPSDHPRAAVIAAAGKAGLVNGYANGDGTFRFSPDNTITRAEVVKVINNAKGRKVGAATPGFRIPAIFKDIDASHWAYYDVMEASVGHKVAAPEDDAIERWETTVGLEIKDFTEGEAYVAELDTLKSARIEEIRNTATEIEVLGKTYYVSAQGNDSNDGLSANTAIKTLEKLGTINVESGDAVLFRRGDTFRGTITAAGGVTYSAYGEGAKPIITPSPENAAYKEAWILTETPNVYKYHREIKNVGGIFMNGGEDYGYLVVVGNDGIDKTSKKAYTGLASLENKYFYSDLETGELYLRWDAGNPGEIYDSVELNTGVSAISCGSRSNITIDNLHIRNAGIHGVAASAGNSLTVKNCEIGWIGGSIQGGKGTTRLGNGVEVYGGTNGYYVDNCYVYECYDAGITHQISSGSSRIIMKDVVYTNNLIEKCNYNIEYFLSAPTNEQVERRMENILFKNNFLSNSGYGWGQQRPDKGNDVHIRTGGNTFNKADNYVIEGNIFDRGRNALLNIGAKYEQWLPVMNNNTYVHTYTRIGAHYGAPNLAAYSFGANFGEVIQKKFGETDYNLYFIK